MCSVALSSIHTESEGFFSLPNESMSLKALFTTGFNKNPPYVSYTEANILIVDLQIQHMHNLLLVFCKGCLREVSRQLIFSAS